MNGLTPYESRRIQKIVANPASELLKGYGKIASNPEVFPHRVCLEAPYTEFYIPHAFLPDKVKELISRFRFHNDAKDLGIEYDLIRFHFSDIDKDVDFKEVWNAMSFMKEAPSAIYCIGNSDNIQILLYAPTYFRHGIESLLKSKYQHLQCEIHSSPGKDFLKQYLPEQTNKLHWDFLDIQTPPPFFHCLKSNTPFESIYSAIRNVEAPNVIVFRLLFTATTQPWERLCRELIHFEADTLVLGYVAKEDLQAAMLKAAGPFFATSIWIAAFATKDMIGPLLSSVSIPFQTMRYGGSEIGFLTKESYVNVISNDNDFINAISSVSTWRAGCLLSPDELASCFSFPYQDLLKNEEYPFTRAMSSRKPVKVNESGAIKLGYTVYAGIAEPVYQTQKTRRLHTVISGKTGKGKTRACLMFALEIINAGLGVAIIDPHNSLVPLILKHIENRMDDVILFDPTDRDYVLKFNPTEHKPGTNIGKVADDITASIRAQYSKNYWGYNIQEHIRNLIEIALWVPGMNILDIIVLIEGGPGSARIREKALGQVQNPELMRYLRDVLPKTSQAQMERVTSKIAPFLKDEYVGRIFYERENAFNFREIIDTGKIFLASNPTGVIGGASADILCSTLASFFYHAAFSRQDIPEDERTDYSLFMDEYQRITTHDSEDAVRECRKHRLSLFMAYQQRGQMPDNIRTAMQNCDTLISFDAGLEDAQALFKEFFGEVPLKNLMRKGERKAFCMMEGDIFNLQIYPTPPPPSQDYEKEIRERNHRLYYVPRAEAEYYKAIKRNAEERNKMTRTKPSLRDRFDEI